jgi:hypothetical protein
MAKKKLVGTMNPVNPFDEKAVCVQQAPLTVELVSLDSLRVDKAQPRKLNIAHTLGETSDTASFPKVPYSDGDPKVPYSDGDDDGDDDGDSKPIDSHAAIVALARDILKRGVHTPISVTRIPPAPSELPPSEAENVTHKIVAGERRARAARLAAYWVQQSKSGKGPDISDLIRKDGYNYDQIMAVVLEDYEDAAERFEVQLSENILRQDMTNEETALAFKHLLDTEVYKNVPELATRFGLSTSTVYNMLATVREADTAQALRDMGVTNAQFIGKLCAAVTRSRDVGESDCAVYNAFVEKWKAVKSDGKAPYARGIWDEVTKSIAGKAVAVEPSIVSSEIVDKDGDETDEIFGQDTQPTSDNTVSSEMAEHTGGNEGFVIPEDDLTIETVEASEQPTRKVTDAEEEKLYKNMVSASTAELFSTQSTAAASVNIAPTITVPTVELSENQARNILALLGCGANSLTVTGAMVANALVDFVPKTPHV